MNEIPFRGILPATLTTPGAVASWCEAHAAVRQAAALRAAWSRDRLRARGFSGDGAPGGLDRSDSAPELGQQSECGGNFPARRRRAARRREAGQSGPRAHAARRWPRPDAPASTKGAVGAGAGALRAGKRRLLRRRRPRARSGQRWGEPLQGTYRDVTLYETPAPTQGFTVLQMLKLIEPFELHKHGIRRTRPRAPDGAGQADRVSRPRPLDRRSRVRQGADGAAALRSISRRAPRA